MLELIEVSKKWPEFNISRVSMYCRKGEYFVIMGPTGAGKTLLLQLIAGIEYPDSGSILIDDLDVTYHPPEKRRVGYVPQNYALFPHLDVFENIAFGLKLRKLSRLEIEKRVKELAEHLGIEHLLHRDVKTLSGGEQQRVALARALAVDPSILLLDEPLSALDTKTRESLRDYLKKINKDFQVTAVHVTHDFIEALSLADRMAIMNKGQLLQVGTPDEILSHPSNRFVAEFTGSINVLRGKASPREGATEIKVANTSVWAIGQHQGEVTAIIRPESILVAKEKPRTSARNVFQATVDGIEHRGAVYAVKLITDEGLSFTAYITRSALLELDLKPGDRAFLFFKASEVHLLR
ncbi:MAG: ABC transporter ATP-binding protein [Candidatus Verstraetearchaeota archaeon]|nr:ABC transporter ATP-binding protein [Candidatus Verstraetearchaeota archaeon]